MLFRSKMDTIDENVVVASGPKCDVCTNFTTLGSNAFIRMWTCKDCGNVTKEDIEPPAGDPKTCLHINYDHRKSSKKGIQFYCRDCGTYFQRIPKEEFKSCSDLARQTKSIVAQDPMVKDIVSKTF